MERDAVTLRKVWKVFRSGQVETFDDDLLRERTLTLVVDGKEEAVVVLSPGDEELWALGHLFSKRMIGSRDEILSVETTADGLSVRRRLPLRGLTPESRPVRRASAGPSEACGGRKAPPPLPVRWALEAASLFEAVDALAEGPLFRRTGSAHVALLASKEGRPLFRVEDGGRHNAMDKAIGWAVREGIDLADCFMALSGRLAADMVRKALDAGLPLLASVSAATASGVETAAAGGVTLVGFVRKGKMNVYSVPERIVELAPRA
ncbi:formate dehydrogenase accessory sulfurtransferase FdhD [Aminithiophilus ramosus]|uniref:Sulfur carrier protein FdhD n=2 Tax=Synergistales TaxID=649776 RepID=A0A9Q7EYV2_9BACT|nr:formate dehydrogenase accessory sulfurtransferase FdhD [Aminithiophilus ramosus]QTX32426.1 formate dehydrogenase accessory sulfurtransferase FdhD [Aminithiophilus ramosus]QVL36303.1 formate dehydrogenase accessory sulfurtransferase FdhD [Synergistota bacterium]